jgi:hypothetical protein
VRWSCDADVRKLRVERDKQRGQNTIYICTAPHFVTKAIMVLLIVFYLDTRGAIIIEAASKWHAAATHVMSNTIGP